MIIMMYSRFITFHSRFPRGGFLQLEWKDEMLEQQGAQIAQQGAQLAELKATIAELQSAIPASLKIRFVE